MVFSSLPLYLDPPNWQQQHPNPQHHEFQSPQVLVSQPAQQGGGVLLMGGSTTALSSTQPGSSMADRARQVKIPVPEGPLKCPRCESTNTKFCYFNNYSLSQPRHFCKTCRRYWTRGGSLRSVPVGGGCRRNKRKKTGRAPKSPSKAELPRHTPPSTTVGPSTDFSGGHHLLQAVGPAPPPPFSFMASLQNLTQLGMGNLELLNFSALGMGGANNSGSHLGGYGEDEVHQQGQPQQLPNLLSGFGSAAPSSIYPFQNMEGMETASYGKGLGVQNHQLQQAGVKMESVGVGQHQQQFWNNGGTGSTTGASGGLWTDLSGICSSSPSTHSILR